MDKIFAAFRIYEKQQCGNILADSERTSQHCLSLCQKHTAVPALIHTDTTGTTNSQIFRHRQPYQPWLSDNKRQNWTLKSCAGEAAYKSQKQTHSTVAVSVMLIQWRLALLCKINVIILQETSVGCRWCGIWQSTQTWVNVWVVKEICVISQIIQHPHCDRIRTPTHACVLTQVGEGVAKHLQTCWVILPVRAGTV